MPGLHVGHAESSLLGKVVRIGRRNMISAGAGRPVSMGVARRLSRA